MERDRILILEDDEESRQLLLIMVESCVDMGNVEIDLAENMNRAVGQLFLNTKLIIATREAHSGSLPGEDFLRFVRGSSQKRGVIALTTSTFPETMDNLTKLGAGVVLLKPFPLKKFQQSIKTVCPELLR